MPPAHAHTAPSPGPHSVWLALGLVAAMLTVIQVARHGAGALTAALAVAITPDLTMFIGLSRRLAHRQLAPTAVPFYNIAHRLRRPLALLAAGASWPSSAALVAGVRTPEGFQRG